MKAKENVALVCLDLGGVLIRVCRTWDEACRHAHLDLPRALQDPDVIKRIATASRLHETGETDEEQFDLRVASLTGLTVCQVDSAVDHYLRGPYLGAGDLVKRLAETPGIASGCLSNTNTRHWTAMRAGGRYSVGLEQLTWRFLSFEIRAYKPEPVIYQHVEQVSGIAPQQILFFDDNADNVAAARERGWSAEHIDPHADPVSQVSAALQRYGIF